MTSKTYERHLLHAAHTHAVSSKVRWRKHIMLWMSVWLALHRSKRRLCCPLQYPGLHLHPTIMHCQQGRLCRRALHLLWPHSQRPWPMHWCLLYTLIGAAGPGWVCPPTEPWHHGNHHCWIPGQYDKLISWLMAVNYNAWGMHPTTSPWILRTELSSQGHLPCSMSVWDSLLVASLL